MHWQSGYDPLRVPIQRSYTFLTIRYMVPGSRICGAGRRTQENFSVLPVSCPSTISMISSSKSSSTSGHRWQNLGRLPENTCSTEGALTGDAELSVAHQGRMESHVHSLL